MKYNDQFIFVENRRPTSPPAVAELETGQTMPHGYEYLRKQEDENHLRGPEQIYMEIIDNPKTGTKTFLTPTAKAKTPEENSVTITDNKTNSSVNYGKYPNHYETSLSDI